MAVLGWASAGCADTFTLDGLSFVTVGTAKAINSGWLLTDNTDPRLEKDPLDTVSPAGAIWTTSPVSVGSGFSMSFNFRMWGANGYPDPGGSGPLDANGNAVGADGFAFVIQNDPYAYNNWRNPAGGSHALGIGAGGMGYMYINNSLAVEFDTYQNDPEKYADPNGNHIGVQSRGTKFNVPNHTCEGYSKDGLDIYGGCTGSPDLGHKEVGDLLNDGSIQSAKIVYADNDLSVYLNSVLLIDTPVDLDSLLKLQDGTDAYIGFTAGTRYGYENHAILTPEPSPLIMLLFGIAPLASALRRRRANWR